MAPFGLQVVPPVVWGLGAIQFGFRQKPNTKPNLRKVIRKRKKKLRKGAGEEEMKRKEESKKK